MQQEITQILWNQPAGGSVYRIGLTSGSQYAFADPGQFVTLRLPEETEPLLRRPFSIHRVLQESNGVRGIEILYKSVGGFTRKLTHAAPGDRVDMLGPLGNGFTVSSSIQRAVLAAGGIGVAPMVFLAESLLQAGLCPSRLNVCLGGRTAADVLCQEQFQALGLSPQIATEDGSLGQKGRVTRLLEKVLALNQTGQADRVYACGPMPMLHAVAELANRHESPCEVSIETLMACGVGACLGCAIKDSHHKSGYGHVCIDGPVFEASRLQLDGGVEE